MTNPTTLPTICIDFDGVIHSYDRGWQNGEIYGEVVPGFFEWVGTARLSFSLVVYSSRSKTESFRDAMGEWLEREFFAWCEQQGIDWNEPPPWTLAHEKPPAWITIDDRAICFNGNWAAQELSVDSIKAFRPWNQKVTNV